MSTKSLKEVQLNEYV